MLRTHATRMSSEPIQFYNRYTDQIETEQIYGEGFLRWVYENPLGQLALHAFVKRQAFSRWYGWRMDRRKSRGKVQPFIENYGVDVAEFAADSETYQTFNEFFFRKLTSEARPIRGAEDVAVFPADGRHLGFANIAEMDGVFVKGQTFSLEDLLGDSRLAKRYREGSMLLSRLCPTDYHRFHFPVSGVATATEMVKGPLYSVNPIALRQRIRILAENKRAICEIQSKEFGRVVMLEIGATCVGGFEYTYDAGAVRKGAEKGFFKFGGSSTMLLFEPGRIAFDEDLLEHSREHRELYAHMGDRLGLGIA
jgi:phosphatidylserine decarboxylase